MEARTCSGQRAFPNKHVIQGMDLVYSQTKSGHPSECANYSKSDK